MPTRNCPTCGIVRVIPPVSPLDDDPPPFDLAIADEVEQLRADRIAAQEREQGLISAALTFRAGVHGEGCDCHHCGSLLSAMTMATEAQSA